jgi:hypothetical protein
MKHQKKHFAICIRNEGAEDLAGVYCGSAPYSTAVRQKSFDFLEIEK